jgi:hypothetical protein
MEAAREDVVRRPGSGGTHVHDDVARRGCTLLNAEPLAQQSLETVARDGATGGAHADRQAEPRMTQRILTRDHEEIRIAGTPALAIEGVELALLGESPAARKPAP